MLIKNESASTRCEVCHQSDCYTPETNHCTRCQGIPNLISQGRKQAAAPTRSPQFGGLGEHQADNPVLELLGNWHRQLAAFHPLLPLGLGGFSCSTVLMATIAFLLFPRLGSAVVLWAGVMSVFLGGMVWRRKIRSSPYSVVFSGLVLVPGMIVGGLLGLLGYGWLLTPGWEKVLDQPEAVQSMLWLRKSPPAGALYDAAFQGKATTVKLLLEAGQNVNRANQAGRTPLLAACDQGRDEVVKILLDAGAEVNHVDQDGMSALLLATRAKVAGARQAEAPRLLLAKGAQVEVTDALQRTPLMYAAEKGDVETVRLLLEKGANPNAQDRDGETALLLAEREPYQTSVPGEVARMLLKAKANPNLSNQQGRTPLMVAVEALKNPVLVEPLRDLLESGANPKTATPKGETALRLLGDTGSAGAARLLFQYGAEKDVNANYALATAARNGHSALALVLLENGANPNAYVGEYGYPPVVLALRGKQEDTFRVLLEHKANGNLVNSQGDSILTEAVCYATPGIVRTLLFHSRLVNYQNPDGISALMYAVRNNEEEMIRDLLAAGANPNQQDKEGHPVLRYAVPHSNPRVVRMLLDRGAKSGSDPAVATMLEQLGFGR